MSHTIKTVKIAPWNCLFLKASGEILCPKGNSTEWVFGVSWDLRFAFTLFSHSRRWKQREKIPAFGSESQKGRRYGKFSQRGQSPAREVCFHLPWSWVGFDVWNLSTFKIVRSGRKVTNRRKKMFRFALILLKAEALQTRLYCQVALYRNIK